MHQHTKEIFLVRDFRDVVCSIFAFNASRGHMDFGREVVKTDEEYIPVLGQAVQRLFENYRHRRKHSLLVRYEDLICNPTPTIKTILKYLELEASEAAIADLIRKANQDSPELQKHRTSASPQASIGRWRCDLSEPLQRLCRLTFDDLLRDFGYRISSDGHLKDYDTIGVVSRPPQHLPGMLVKG
jgi:hypothetical protein